MKKVVLIFTLLLALFSAKKSTAQILYVQNNTGCEYVITAFAVDGADWACTGNIYIPAWVTSPVGFAAFKSLNLWKDGASGTPFPSGIPAHWDWSHIRIADISSGTGTPGPSSVVGPNVTNILGTFTTPAAVTSCGGVVPITATIMGNDLYIVIN